MPDEQLGYFEAAGVDSSDLEFKLLPVLTDEGAPPKGIYLVKASARYQVSKALNDMVTLTFEVLAPEEFAGQSITDRLMFSPKKFEKGNSNGSPLAMTMDRLERVFGSDWTRALPQGDLVDVLIPAIVAQFTDHDMCVKVLQREEEYEGTKTMKNRITQYYPIDAYEGVE